jgi:hypothetical protein
MMEEKPANALLVLLVLAGLVAAADVVFAQLGHHYFSWYLAQGGLISVTVSAIAFATDLDQDPYRVSAHPARYIGAWMRVPGETFTKLAQLVRSDDAAGLDAIITGLIGLCLIPLWIGWLIVIAPIQYFLTVVAGAPARCAATGDGHTWAASLSSHPVTATSALGAGVLFAAAAVV